jgi:hypothetical protein
MAVRSNRDARSRTQKNAAAHLYGDAARVSACSRIRPGRFAGAVIVIGLVMLVRVGLAQNDCIVIEDFAKAKVGEFPPGWKVRKDEGRSIYTVQEEGGLRLLRAVSKGLGIQAAKAYEWDLNRYPVLAWSWRPREFPRGADERDSRKNDSVLSVYMLVPHSQIRGPKAVKYIWSERVPVGTRLESNGGLTQVRVLESGTDRRDQWVEEHVNVRNDYLEYFQEDEVPKPAGIAVLTDSDDTHSGAQGDYAKFRACSERDAARGSILVARR